MLHQKKKIVVMGGSFNPIHLGHIAVAKHVKQCLQNAGHVIDEVWLLPSKQNPTKSKADLAPFDDRMAMCELATKHEESWLKVYDYEQNVPELFTYFTFRYLYKKFPEYQFVWLMGSDNMIEFHGWDYGKELADTVPIVVYGRDCSVKDALLSPTAATYHDEIVSLDAPFDSSPNWRVIHDNLVSGRSTDIRTALLEGAEVPDLNPLVLEYIQKHNLYSD